MCASRILVGISQRVEMITSYGERRDSLDQSWTTFLHACDIDAVIIPNMHPDPLNYIRKVGVCGIILTGGGNISSSLKTIDGDFCDYSLTKVNLSSERDVTESKLLLGSIKYNLPLIGICRGMQVLNLFHGGRIERIDGHVGLNHSLIKTSASKLINKYTFDKEVNSYHEFGITKGSLGNGLVSLAEIDGMQEAISHNKYQHLGLMWHPERNEPFSNNDIYLFKNFFGNLIKK